MKFLFIQSIFRYEHTKSTDIKNVRLAEIKFLKHESRINRRKWDRKTKKFIETSSIHVLCKPLEISMTKRAFKIMIVFLSIPIFLLKLKQKHEQMFNLSYFHKLILIRLWHPFFLLSGKFYFTTKKIKQVMMAMFSYASNAFPSFCNQSSRLFI